MGRWLWHCLRVCARLRLQFSTWCARKHEAVCSRIVYAVEVYSVSLEPSLMALSHLSIYPQHFQLFVRILPLYTAAVSIGNFNRVNDERYHPAFDEEKNPTGVVEDYGATFIFSLFGNTR